MLPYLQSRAQQVACGAGPALCADAEGDAGGRRGRSLACGGATRAGNAHELSGRQTVGGEDSRRRRRPPPGRRRCRAPACASGRLRALLQGATEQGGATRLACGVCPGGSGLRCLRHGAPASLEAIESLGRALDGGEGSAGGCNVAPTAVTGSMRGAGAGTSPASPVIPAPLNTTSSAWDGLSTPPLMSRCAEGQQEVGSRQRAGGEARPDGCTWGTCLGGRRVEGREESSEVR